MPLFSLSVDSATSAGPGLVIFFDVPKTATVTDAGDAHVTLETTLDGIVWKEVAANNASGFGTPVGAVSYPALGLRANVITPPSTGSVSASITAA